MGERESVNSALRAVAGSEVVVDVLTWDEGWDFDYPACILRPVVRYSPNGSYPVDMVEDLACDLARGTLTDRTEVENGLVDRAYPLAALKRRWAANRRGVTFPRLRYCASRWAIRFALDADPDADAGDLTWTITALPPHRAVPSPTRKAKEGRGKNG